MLCAQEPRCPASQMGAGCPDGVTAFFADLSCYIKGIAPNQLVRPCMHADEAAITAWMCRTHVHACSAGAPVRPWYGIDVFGMHASI